MLQYSRTPGAHPQGAIFNEMRSKTKVLQEELGLNPADYPDWSFDGSSTGQASGDNSDCILKCVCMLPCTLLSVSCLSRRRALETHDRRRVMGRVSCPSHMPTP